MPGKRKSLVLLAAEKVARDSGARIEVEPEWKMTGYLEKGKKRAFFSGPAIDINSSGATALAKDKDHTAYFLERAGYPVVPNSQTFFSAAWGATIGVENRGVEAACQHAEAVGYPVVVKPNSGTQGKGVVMAYKKSELVAALRSIFLYDQVALVQEYVRASDYRFAMLDGEVVAAYERVPFSVYGDGCSTIAELLTKQYELFRGQGRHIPDITGDGRLGQKLSRLRLSLESVVALGEKVPLLDAANASLGGTVVDATKLVHPKFLKLVKNISREVGLRWCGIDILVDGSVSEPPNKYWVLEVNGAPGLSHYAASGPSARRRALQIYEEIFRRALKS